MRPGYWLLPGYGNFHTTYIGNVVLAVKIIVFLIYSFSLSLFLTFLFILMLRIELLIINIQEDEFNI